MSRTWQNEKSSTYLVELLGGSDRDCTVTYDFSTHKLHEQQEIVDPVLRLPYRKSQGRYSAPRTRIPEDQWGEVAQRHALGESLRLLAKLYGVSHEAVRQVLHRYQASIEPLSGCVRPLAPAPVVRPAP